MPSLKLQPQSARLHSVQKIGQNVHRVGLGQSVRHAPPRHRLGKIRHQILRRAQTSHEVLIGPPASSGQRIVPTHVQSAPAHGPRVGIVEIAPGHGRQAANAILTAMPGLLPPHRNPDHPRRS